MTVLEDRDSSVVVVDLGTDMADAQRETSCANYASPTLGELGPRDVGAFPSLPRVTDSVPHPIFGKVLRALADECAAARAVIHGSRQPFAHELHRVAELPESELQP